MKPKLYELARKDDPIRTKWISWLAEFTCGEEGKLVPERPRHDRVIRRR